MFETTTTSPPPIVELGRILPGHAIPLETEEGIDARRFRRLFRETWRTVPLGWRRDILRLWRDGGPHHRAGVRLTRGLYPINIFGHELLAVAPLDAMAAVNHRGCLVRFCDRWIGRLSDQAVRTLVAHELGHVCFAARGGGFACDDEEHDYLYDLMLAWGYDDADIDRELARQVPR